MSLADRLVPGPKPTLKGPPCALGKLLSGLDDGDASALRSMLADSSWTGAAIAGVLMDEDLAHVQPSTVQRHRRGECSCGLRGLR